MDFLNSQLWAKLGKHTETYKQIAYVFWIILADYFPNQFEIEINHVLELHKVTEHVHWQEEALHTHKKIIINHQYNIVYFSTETWQHVFWDKGWRCKIPHPSGEWSRCSDCMHTHTSTHTSTHTYTILIKKKDIIRETIWKRLCGFVSIECLNQVKVGHLVVNNENVSLSYK